MMFEKGRALTISLNKVERVCGGEFCDVILSECYFLVFSSTKTLKAIGFENLIIYLKFTNRNSR